MTKIAVKCQMLETSLEEFHLRVEIECIYSGLNERNTSSLWEFIRGFEKYHLPPALPICPCSLQCSCTYFVFYVCESCAIWLYILLKAWMELSWTFGYKHATLNEKNGTWLLSAGALYEKRFFSLSFCFTCNCHALFSWEYGDRRYMHLNIVNMERE